MFRPAALLFSLTLLAGAPLDAQTFDSLPLPDSATMRAARTLLTAMRAGELFISSSERQIAIMRTTLGDRLSKEFADGFLAEVRASAPQLMEATAVIYARHFTKAELEGLTQFFRTPLGQSYAAKQQEILAESMQIGVRWGTEAAKRVQDRLPQRGTPPTLITSPP